mgnify:CR=1 FL=1
MRGVLFDFDGTLADTMQSHYEAWRVSLNNIGIPSTGGQSGTITNP